jgi:hypothetical protein
VEPHEEKNLKVEPDPEVSALNLIEVEISSYLVSTI